MKYILPCLLVFFLSCGKDAGEDDRELPVVEISSPLPGIRVNSGSTVAITGLVSDNQRISELHVHISNQTTGALLVDIHRFPAAASYTLNESFVVPHAATSYRIQVIAKDNSANEGRSTVEISSN